MKKITLIIGLLATAGVVYWLASGRSGGDDSGLPPSPKIASALSGPTLEGKTISLSGYAGKIVLVDFWATWCDPCKEEIPDLVKLYDKYKGKGFVLLGVSMDDEGASAVRKFLNGGERPPDGWVVPGLPSAYLVGRDGRILKRWFGTKDPAELEGAVVAALGL
jgi:thiol-disulfide isomerase/thioredoxin